MSYDGYGNIRTKNGKAYTYGNSVWKDLLTSYGGQAISYDAQGNPTSYLGHTLTWEKGRQLKSFDSNAYTYNASGIRMTKTVGGVKHTYTLDGTKIIREVWGSNTLSPLYDVDDSVCGINYNGNYYYFAKNLQGDIIAIVDKDAKTVARYSYDAWGVPTVVSDSSGSSIAMINPFRYRGYYYDAEIGMYYLQSRYYNPVVGRFINADSSSYIGSGNTHLSYNVNIYCENDCINYVDYFGHSPSLSTLTKMHNMVVFHAQLALLLTGTLTSSEVRTCNASGAYNGRMDIYSYLSSEVWEVKRNNERGIKAGIKQLERYTSSYVYPLYHFPYRKIIVRPILGTKSVFGGFFLEYYFVFFFSCLAFPALILYDYMAEDKVAKILFILITATSVLYLSQLIKSAKKLKTNIELALIRIKYVIMVAKRNSNDALKALEDFMREATPYILMAICAIILCIFVYHLVEMLAAFAVAA